MTHLRPRGGNEWPVRFPSLREVLWVNRGLVGRAALDGRGGEGMGCGL